MTYRYLMAWSLPAMALFCSPPAVASSASTGTIAGVSSAVEGLGSFVHNGTRSQLPACAGSTVWSINLATPGGPATMAALLSAYLAGKPVSVSGTGTCNAYGQEYVGYISF